MFHSAARSLPSAARGGEAGPRFVHAHEKSLRSTVALLARAKPKEPTTGVGWTAGLTLIDLRGRARGARGEGAGVSVDSKAAAIMGRLVDALRPFAEVDVDTHFDDGPTPDNQYALYQMGKGVLVAGQIREARVVLNMAERELSGYRGMFMPLPAHRPSGEFWPDGRSAVE